MPSILIVGIIIFVGFVFAETLKRFGLPKVTGYILGGVFLNPDLMKIIPVEFVNRTGLITNIALSFIAFSVGGTIIFPKIKKMGKTLLFITILESELAALLVFLGFLCVSPFLAHLSHASFLRTIIPFSLLVCCLASPTDPSASLAIVHEYDAKGEVSSTIMGVAAFDDILGIMNFSFATVIAGVLINGQPLDLCATILNPLLTIAGSILFGCFAGMLFNVLTEKFQKETEGALIVIIFALLFLCFGLANYWKLDELLANMSMGVTVVNFNRHGRKIFNMLERYTEEFIFVLFFTLSGMHLKFTVIPQAVIFILMFFIFRSIGKFLGVYTGARLAKASEKVRRFTAGGLIPQGGIVVGLALLIQQDAAFASVSELVMGVIIGSTIVHEFVGPILAKMALKKADEI